MYHEYFSYKYIFMIMKRRRKIYLKCVKVNDIRRPYVCCRIIRINNKSSKILFLMNTTFVYSCFILSFFYLISKKNLLVFFYLQTHMDLDFYKKFYQIIRQFTETQWIDISFYLTCL